MKMLGAINLLADVGGSFWLPPSASSYAGESDWLFWFIMIICIVFFLLVAFLTALFAWKYRYREGAPVQESPKHSTALELTWTFVPTMLMVVIFVYGFKGFVRMSQPPPNSYEIVVYGSMWQFQFQYPNGHQDTELHVPLGVPVQYVLSSSDVIHGFYIPAFRVKKDIVPGRYNRIWAQAEVAGVYDIFCTQYCGDKHSQMRAKVTVEDRATYDKWLSDATLKDSQLPPVDHGRLLWNRKCSSCHTIDGTASTGPTWKNLFGHEVEFADGSKTIADENYIRSMITNPNNRLVKGFQPVMPSFQGQLKDATHDVDHLIEFIKSVSDKYTPPATTMTAGATSQPTAPPQ